MRRNCSQCEIIKKALIALIEVVDALGDIPADKATKQQQKAYRICIEVRDGLISEEK